MKNHCRRILAALVLTLALTPSAFADDGIIQCGKAMDGIIYGGASVPLTELGLSLLQLLSQF